MDRFVAIVCVYHFNLFCNHFIYQRCRGVSLSCDNIWILFIIIILSQHNQTFTNHTLTTAVSVMLSNVAATCAEPLDLGGSSTFFDEEDEV
jgi:hypothetical protein